MTTADSQRRAPVWIVSIVIAIVLFHYTGLLSPIEKLSQRVLQPLGRSLSSLTAKANVSRGNKETEFNNRIRALEDRLAVLSIENVELRRSLDAATDIAEQRAFTRERKLNGIAGRIYARSPDPSSAYVAIDIGADDGVAVGNPAIIKDGIIVGVVISVDRVSARILLSTDNRSSFAAVVAGQPGAQGVVSGARGLSLRMELIPQSENLIAGKIVTTSGLDPNIPPGLLLGEIERVDRQEGALFQSSSLRPLYGAPRLDAVTIITHQLP